MSLIPDDYQDLVADDSQAIAYLATILASGAPITAPVWFDFHEGHIRIVTEPDSLKVKNVQRQPAVSIILQDPKKTYRYMQIRGTFVGSTKDTEGLLNRLSRRYIGRDYPGIPSPDNLILTFKPEKVNVFSWEHGE